MGPIYSVFEFFMWGAGGGSGSQQRSGPQYITSTYYSVKEGGAGGFVSGSYRIQNGTQLLLTVGQSGFGGLVGGNPSDAVATYNGGGAGTYTTNDASGSGGGYTGVFLNGLGKSQNGAIAIAPGGGGGAGGPGYPSNTSDQANGGGGITTNGIGNNGTRNYGFFTAVAGGGGLTSGGTGGDASVTNGDGAVGSALTGASAVHHRNAWGSGGGGGGGWFGGGSGANDHNSWSGGGGGAGSAFVRGSGITYNTAGNSSIIGVQYMSHVFTLQTYGRYGDNSTNSYNSMRMPVETTNARYPGSSVGYGGAFNNGGSRPVGLNGGNGVIIYRINGGDWATVSYTGTDQNLTIQ